MNTFRGTDLRVCPNYWSTFISEWFLRDALSIVIVFDLTFEVLNFRNMLAAFGVAEMFFDVPSPSSSDA